MIRTQMTISRTTVAFIQTKQLVKHFNGVKAVDGISFSIDQGCCFGLLGPNGAGKTTTVEILEGIKVPTSGEVLYKGQPLGETFRNEAGIMFQATALQDYITVQEALELFRSFYARSTPLEQIIKNYELHSILKQDTRSLSGGQRQRLLLAISLLNDPEIIFLDEPTTGLDPRARRNFWDLLHDIKKQNKTVILTTHYMEEAYELCDEIAIMDQGKIIAQGTPKALLKEHFDDVIVQIPKEDFQGALDEFPMKALQTQDIIQIPTNDVNTCIQQLLQRGITLSRLQIRERTLDDLFLELTGKGLKESC